MSAIAGIVSQSGPVNAQAVRAMIGLMAHRGPEAAGHWLGDDGRVALGHRRLATIDTSPASAQPFLAGPVALVFDGEIYNYREVRAELTSRGHLFTTEGDAEVAAAAWRRWGAPCVEFFNGAFAFALWDGERRQLFCARDRLGEKPFLYARGPGWLAFASEYRALLSLEGVSSSHDEARLAGFLAHPGQGLEQGEATLFPAIAQLPPGHTLLVAADSLRSRRQCHWTARPAAEARRLSLHDAANTLRDLLGDAVRLRLRGQAPIGAGLSGGVGSAAVLALARRELDDDAPLPAFSCHFPDTSADETLYMDAVAAAIPVRRHQVAPTAAALLDDLAELAWSGEVPVETAAHYTRYRLFRLARHHGITVLLDGQGLDEVLAGHERYFAAYHQGGADISPLVRSRYGEAVAAAPSAWNRLMNRWLGRRPLADAGDLLAGLAGTAAAAGAAEPASLHQALRHDALGGPLSAALRAGDRLAMAQGVELRRPFADHRLFELVQGLPAEYLMGEGQTKRLLRLAMEGLIPDMVRLRWRKHDPSPPLVSWMHQALLPAVEAALEDPGLSPLWNRDWGRLALRHFRAGDTALAPALWRLLATETWRLHFLAPLRGRTKFAPLA